MGRSADTLFSLYKRARLNRLLAINLGSVGLAALGLAMLVAGLML